MPHSNFNIVRNLMVNFKPGEHMTKMFFFSVTGSLEETIQEITIGFKPMTFWPQLFKH